MRWLALALFCSLLTGCVGEDAATDSAPANEPTPLPEGNPQPRNETTRPVEPAEASSVALPAVAPPVRRLGMMDRYANATLYDFTNITQFHWATDEPLQGPALALHFDNGDNECRIMTHVTSHNARPGSRYVVLREKDQSTGWNSGGQPSGVQAMGQRLGEGVIWSPGEGGGGGGGRGATNGPFSVTIVANDARPVDWINDVAGGITVDVTCDQPFSMTGATPGNGVVGSGAGMDGGVSGEVVLVGGAEVAASITLETAGPGRAAWGGFGTHAGRIDTATPGDSYQDLISPGFGQTFVRDGEAGAYSVTAYRAGAYFEAFWAAIWETGEPVDLSPGILQAKAWNDPF